MAFYTNLFVRAGFAGCACGPLIFIRPTYRNDAGLLAHEQEHVKQFWRSPFMHGLRYRFSKPYRLACEVAAYRVQASRYQDDRRPMLAGFIADKYELGITQAEALELLK